MIELADEDATLALGVRVASVARAGGWLALEGPLGAGKTTLARGIARGLGLSTDVHVTSPTFALVQEYDTTPVFLHGDLYRLSHPSELELLGLLEAMEEGAVVALEWALPFVQDLGPPDLVLTLHRVQDQGRQLTYAGPLMLALDAAVADMRAL